eukprot:TRINITY_DN1781_c0_g1_i2.p1 TRINITY_DN1781_c0_g1~~TRINITY_DN1781_c0_g1_i2.p1  ORF type:complete len:464 (+),score=48.62 TRINITY_DN1781_c0_g1_i2:171-1562(+)
MSENHNRERKVIEFKPPKDILNEMNIKIEGDACGITGILGELQKSLDYSMKTGHVRFFNQLFAGTDKAAIIAEWLTSVMNTCMFTYEVAPVFTLMEIEVVEKVKQLVGWKDGEGVFAPGGAHCNMLGMIAARHSFDTNIRKVGIFNHTNTICFTSSHSHYTITRCCSVLGFGMNACHKVPVDRATGKIIVSELDRQMSEAIKNKKQIFAVCITSGTTVFGAYDDIDAVAQICNKYKVWLHVDACWGGSCLFSEKHKHLMKGCEKADSISWTASKCIGLPLHCSLLLLKQKGILYSCNSMQQDYLFHDHPEKNFDLGDKTLSCGTKVDSFKLWVSWKVHGDEGFKKRFLHGFEQAQYLTERIKSKKESFELVMDNPESLNVCFFFIPPSVRSLGNDDKQRRKKMSDSTEIIRRRMYLEGRTLSNYASIDGIEGTFWRMITCNLDAEHQDMDFVVSEIERLGNDL